MTDDEKHRANDLIRKIQDEARREPLLEIEDLKHQLSQAVMTNRCIACPMEVRNLFAVAKNVVTSINDMERLGHKLQQLKMAVKNFQPIIDQHFSDPKHWTNLNEIS
jgi:hypothetical protein